MKLLVGVIPMLIVAGILEAFFSPSGAPVFLKFTAAAVLFGLFVAYAFLGAPARPDSVP